MPAVTTRFVLLAVCAAALVALCTVMYLYRPRLALTSTLSERLLNERRVRDRVGTDDITGERGAEGQRVVVSLATFVGRDAFVNTTIQSLLRQSRPPDRIYLGVATKVHRLGDDNAGAPTSVSSVVRELERQLQGVLVVLADAPDYGPVSKLANALAHEDAPDTIIITADDDVTYHPDTIRALVLTMDALKTDYAVCFSCETFKFGRSWHQLGEGECPGWLGGFAGAAYRRRYFDKDLAMTVDHSRYGAPAGCRLHDDVWISGLLFKRFIRPYVINPGFWSVTAHRPYNALSIHSVPKTEGDYRDPCIRFFDGFNKHYASPKSPRDAWP